MCSKFDSELVCNHNLIWLFLLYETAFRVSVIRFSVVSISTFCDQQCLCYLFWCFSSCKTHHKFATPSISWFLIRNDFQLYILYSPKSVNFKTASFKMNLKTKSLSCGTCIFLNHIWWLIAIEVFCLICDSEGFCRSPSVL